MRFRTEKSVISNYIIEKRDYAQLLVEMINAVEAEGLKVERNLMNDALKELMKAIQ